MHEARKRSSSTLLCFPVHILKLRLESVRGCSQDVLVTLLNNLKVQERQNRVCTTVAIAIVAETCSPFTVLPALMNEYKVRARGLIRRCDAGTAAACASLPGDEEGLL